MSRGYIQTEIFGSFGEYHLRLKIVSTEHSDAPLILNSDEIQEVIENLKSYRDELMRINKKD